MEELLITETQDTPHVHLNRDNGTFEIAGRSLPEDTVDFYTPVVTWLHHYAKSPNPHTDFHIRLEYFNTASSKMILDLLLALREIPGTRIIWHYYEDDEAIDEAGHEYAEQVDIPFVFEIN